MHRHLCPRFFLKGSPRPKIALLETASCGRTRLVSKETHYYYLSNTHAPRATPNSARCKCLLETTTLTPTQIILSSSIGITFRRRRRAEGPAFLIIPAARRLMGNRGLTRLRWGVRRLCFRIGWGRSL